MWYSFCNLSTSAKACVIIWSSSIDKIYSGKKERESLSASIISASIRGLSKLLKILEPVDIILNAKFRMLGADLNTVWYVILGDITSQSIDIKSTSSARCIISPLNCDWSMAKMILLRVDVLFKNGNTLNSLKLNKWVSSIKQASKPSISLRRRHIGAFRLLKAVSTISSLSKRPSCISWSWYALKIKCT